MENKEKNKKNLPIIMSVFGLIVMVCVLYFASKMVKPGEGSRQAAPVDFDIVKIEVDKKSYHVIMSGDIVVVL